MAKKMITLKEYCEDMKVSSYKLEKMCGVSQPCAHRWIAGKVAPTMYNIAVITQVTGGKVTALSFVPEIEYVTPE